MTMISMLCPVCLGDAHERDHAFKCKPKESFMTQSPTSSEETVSVTRWHADSNGDMCNVSTGEIDILTGPYVRASAYDAVVAERDAASADLRGLGMDYETLLKQSNAFEIERDRLRQRVEQLSAALKGLHDDNADYARIDYDHHWMVAARLALSGEK